MTVTLSTSTNSGSGHTYKSNTNQNHMTRENCNVQYESIVQKALSLKSIDNVAIEKRSLWNRSNFHTVKVSSSLFVSASNFFSSMNGNFTTA